MNPTPLYDTPEWQAMRDAKLRQWLGCAPAEAFLRDIGLIAEVWDDLIDGDKKVQAADINRAFFAAVLSLPNNEFFLSHRTTLQPLMLAGVNAWLDANMLETSGSDNDKALAYVLRDWYMELVNMTIFLLRGWEYLRSVSLEVRDFFTQHETLEQYKEKLK